VRGQQSSVDSSPEELKWSLSASVGLRNVLTLLSKISHTSLHFSGLILFHFIIL
jgi:hypothetical protein